jgi:hydrogenase-1 operon protein HyaF
MSRLSDIAIIVEAPVRNGGLGGGVAAVLSELVGMLEKVASGGERATIDLRSLPMSPEDRIELQATLGQGEVQATLNADGISRFRETGVSGVWWVEHHDRHGELIAELIEVSAIPLILEASTEEMALSAHALRDRLSLNPAPSARRNDATLS